MNSAQSSSIRVLCSDHSIPHAHGVLYARRYVPEGSDARTPLVLLHDSLGCVALWRDWPERLASQTRRPVIAYDRLGFGRSSARELLPSIGFVAEEAVEYFPTVQEHFMLERFALFGHSVGGAMCVEIAARRPEACCGVITEAAQAFVEPLTLASIAAAKTKFEDPTELDKLRRYHGEKARWVLDAWATVWLTPEFRAWNLRNALPQVSCPLLAIHGDRDEFGSLAFPELLASQAAKGAKLIIPNCGHVPHREHEAVVIEAVARVLHGLP